MPQQKAFEDVNCLLTSSPVLALFNSASYKNMSANTSSYGLGAETITRGVKTCFLYFLHDNC